MIATERIRNLAVVSIGRGCLLGGLGIATAMVGLSGWPVVAAKLGALGTMLATAVLLLKAARAASRDLTRTELWLLLGRERALVDDETRERIRAVLRDTNLRFATFMAAVSLVFWGVVVVLWLARVEAAPVGLWPY